MSDPSRGLVSTMVGMPTNILSASGLRLARCDFDGDLDHPEAIANARRFVACWNACEGLNTETLEVVPGYKAAIEGFHEQLRLAGEARGQRDQLYALIKNILEAGVFFITAVEADDPTTSDFDLWEKKAKAALAAIDKTTQEVKDEHLPDKSA